MSTASEDIRRYAESGILRHLGENDHLGHPCLFLLGETRERFIQPSDQGGFIPSKREWLELRKRIDAFYATEDGSEIALHNLGLARQYGFLDDEPRPRNRPLLPPPPPKPVDGFIYILVAETGRYKIGRASDLKRRMKQLRTAAAVTFTVLHSIRSADTVRTEKLLHEKFASSRCHGEWFDLTLVDVEWVTSLRDFQLDQGVSQ